MTPLGKGTGLQLKFRLPNTAGDIETSGRVVWSDRKVGMGIQFEDVSSAHERSIAAFIIGSSAGAGEASSRPQQA
jgi:hypothetical protein